MAFQRLFRLMKSPFTAEEIKMSRIKIVIVKGFKFLGLII